ncbi:diguanylate cyclase [Acidocella aquatica]|uniref:7,8-dihydroneopterin aldolase n=1 Tax=Acidocella aquatica TaxID=1922313 RepID=A0ABQ6AAC4_9PROT|nr:dihydroneopterin aldolase [Acidocella aquatica]GLR67079.1 diguanylate cyclase [Acidocella aquatica]
MIQPALALSKTRMETVTALPLRHVLVRDFVLLASIGVFDHEKRRSQRVRINLDLAVLESPGPLDDDLRNVVCYDQIIQAIRALVNGGHNHLVETLGEAISTLCLADPRVRRAVITVEKLDVYEDVAAVGITITRDNPVS